jgi:hypothetical protein
MTTGIRRLGSRFALFCHFPFFLLANAQSIAAINANVRRQKSMCLRVRDAPTGAFHVRYCAIENGARLARAHVFNVALKRVKI